MRTIAAIEGLAHVACVAALVSGSGVARADVHAAPHPAPPTGATAPGALPDPSAAKLAAVQAEFKAKKGDVRYESYVPPGPPPVPKE